MIRDQKISVVIPCYNEEDGVRHVLESMPPYVDEAVVVDQQPVGRVTSARISPLENRCLGLAVVPSRLAAEGNSFQIRSNGQLVKARVHGPPFYDPEGVRLRE